jgi:hypothetical protein
VVLVALALAAVAVLGWLVVDRVRERHLRYAAEEEKWHAAFERILAAPVPPGLVPASPATDAAVHTDTHTDTGEIHGWRLLPGVRRPGRANRSAERGRRCAAGRPARGAAR